MGERGGALGGAMVLTAGQGVSLVLRFLRNLIIARTLTQADFGVASTFAATVTSLELIANLSLAQLIVQNEKGESPDFQKTLHALQLCRGIFMAAVLAALAWPIAYAFDVPDARWAFFVLASVPLIRGFLHSDMSRFERRLRFGPRVISELIPHIVITLGAWPTALWFGDYSVMLWLLVADAIMAVGASHLLADRPYRLGLSKEHTATVIAFAWPLVVNGLLMFLIQQADRYIVGALYSVEELAGYALAATLVAAVHAIPLRIVNQLMLPVLARDQYDTNRFIANYRIVAGGLAVIAATLAAIVIASSPAVAPLFYGERYYHIWPYIVLLSTAQSLRLLRVAPSLACMAKGDTKVLLVANIVRTSGFVLALTMALTGQDLVWIAGAGILGEIPACCTAFLWARWRHALPLRVILVPSAILVIVVGTSMGAAWCMRGSHSAGISAVATGVAITGIGAFGSLSPAAREWMGEILKRIKNR